jgi:hypothetical protein
MKDKQDLNIQHNFTYRLPKSIQDKIVEPLDLSCEIDHENKSKNGGKSDNKQDNKNQIKSIKDIVSDPDPSHSKKMKTSRRQMPKDERWQGYLHETIPPRDM